MRRCLLALAVVLGSAAGAVVACSPVSNNDAFNCQSDGQCNAAAGGACTQSPSGTSFCAYPSGSCDNGLAFGDTAGVNAGQCVSATMGPMAPIDGAVAPLDAFKQLDGSDSFCYGSASDLQVCLPSSDTGSDRTLTGTIYSHGGTVNGTTVTSSCDSVVTSPAPSSLEFCVVSGHNLTLNNLTIEDPSGTTPIVFVAAGSITITGTVEGNSDHGHSAVGPGAFANTTCTTAKGDDNSQGAGGGAGGTFGTQGGNGGEGGANNGATGGGAATQVSSSAGAQISAGCGGGSGGQGNKDGNNNGAPGKAAFSGGVVYLIAINGIDIEGSLDVSGEGGGGGGEAAAGGGGGGTGGFVGLAAPQLTINGFVYANGGAGGGGADLDLATKKGPIVFVQHQYGGTGDDGGSDKADGGNAGGQFAGDGGDQPGTAMAPGGAGHDGKQSQVQGANGAGGGGGGGAGGEGVIWTVGSPQITNPTHLIGVVVQRTDAPG
jgi:hypothetical protein|nr:hypothetical protein [Kofleriaceae bacterium]